MSSRKKCAYVNGRFALASNILPLHFEEQKSIECYAMKESGDIELFRDAELFCFVGVECFALGVLQ